MNRQPHEPEGLAEKERADYRRLAACVRAYGSMVVAFSGGVDSALLAYVAHRELGDRMQCAIGISNSFAQDEYNDAIVFLGQHEIPFREVGTHELDNPAYRRNGPNRCYFCKDELFRRIAGKYRSEQFACVAYGANASDATDHRPGARAAGEHGVAAPLAECGLTKVRVRALARALGLALWDKPAAPCLASRIPYFTGVSRERLARVERAESSVRQLGFRDLRVRHYGDSARVELPVRDHARAADLWRDIEAAVRAAGFRRVVLEPDGLRSGRLNDALDGDRSD